MKDQAAAKFDPLALAGVLVYTAVACYIVLSSASFYSVNLLYSDQWDYYGPLFRGEGLIAQFTYLHPPHRQGLGLVLIGWLASATHWNTRADALAVGAGLCAATLLALWLKVRVFGPIRWTDLLIPAVMLSMRQWEALVGVPNPAHSSLPLVLLMCYALAWTCRHRIVRYALALLFNFLAVFTGFGFFLGLITPILLIIDCLHIIRREGWRPAAPTICVFVLSLVTLGAFFHGYVFDPAAPNFQFPHPRFYLYPQMMALVLASAVGVVGTGWIATVIGWTILLSALAVVLVQTRRLLAEPIDEQQHTRSLVIWLLIFFSLLFIGAMAVGRISLGVQMGTVSRYVTLTTPAIVGLYFHLTRMKLAGWRCPLLCVVVIALSVSALCVRPREERSMRWYLVAKTRWRDIYLQTGDISVANRAIGTSIHPRWDTPEFQAKLDYLRRNRLNLFAR